MAMTPFFADVVRQGPMLRRLVTEGAGGPTVPLQRAAALLSSVAIVLTGMGSSLAAAVAVVPRLTRRGQFALAVDTGELLHAGLPGLARGSGLVVVSQSGRSAEPLGLVRHLAQRPHPPPIIAVTNDLASPLAQEVSVAIPISAGHESSVATITYMGSLLALNRLVDTLLGECETDDISIGRVVDFIDRTVARREEVSEVAEHLARAQTIIVVGRGFGLGAAEYAALTIKEAAAIGAEALAGGAFRHGPLELAGPALGLIVLADAGPTRRLQLRLASEVADMGAPTWLVDTGTAVPARERAGALLCWRLGRVRESQSPFLAAVPLQLLADELAERQGRQAGLLVRSAKVTETE